MLNMKQILNWLHNQSRYFRQIFLYIYLISLIAIMFVGYVLYRQSINTMEKNYSLFSSQLLSNTALLTESKIKEAISISIGAYNSPKVMPYLLDSRYNAVHENSAILDLRNRIGLSNSIHSAYLYNRNLNHISKTKDLYVSGGNYTQQLRYILDKGFKGNIKILLNQAWENKNLSFGRRDIVTLIYKEENWDNSPVSEAIIINIKENSFIQSTIAMPGNAIGNLFILNSDLKVVSHIDKNMVRHDYSQSSVFQKILNTNSSKITLYGDIDGGKCLISSIKNNTLHMFFIHSIPKKELTKEHMQVFLKTIILMLPTFLLVIFLALIATRKLYAPISNLIKQLNTSAGSNEIDMIGSSINHMTQKIHKLLYVQRNQLLRKAIHIGLTEQERDLVLSNNNQIYPVLPCVLILINTDYRCVDNKDPNNLLHLKILNIFKTEYEQDKNMLAIPYKKWKNYLFFSTGNISTNKNVMQKIRVLQERIKLELDISVSIAISEMINDPLDIFHAGQVIRDLIRYRAIYGPSILLNQEVIASHSDKDYSYPLDLDRKIIDTIKINNKEKFCIVLNEFLDEIRKREIETFSFALTQLLINIVITMNTILKQNRSSSNNIHNNPELLLKIQGLEQYRDFFITLFMDFNKNLLNQKRMKTSRGEQIVKDVNICVQKQFANKQLDLSYLADNLKLSANYLSRIYKDETGQNLTSFIRKIRMEEAKKLLLNNFNITIQNIASSCGYSDMNYFTYSFRQYFGTTPSTMRDNNMDLL